MIAIEIVKGRAHWHWRIRDIGNREILCNSETYSSRQEAQIGADGLLVEIGMFPGRKYERLSDKLYRYILNKELVDTGTLTQ